MAIPAYEMMQDDEGVRQRLLSILMRGVSTRHCQEVVPEMASRCGVSKASVSCRFAEASAESLRALRERRFDEADLLVIYIDGQHHGGHQVILAVEVDAQGSKHALGSPREPRRMRWW